MSGTCYYLLSSHQKGFAAAVTGQADSMRATVDVTVNPKARSLETGDDVSLESGVNQTFQLYGPGDIIGFHDRVVERTDPKPEVGDSEPNYFTSVEIGHPDFAWRFTPNAPDNEGNLLPWITLIVLVAEGDKREFSEAGLNDGSAQGNTASKERALPPYINIEDLSAFPDPAHSQRWAHVHVNGPPGLGTEEVLELIRIKPEQAVCRLMCPRLLEPGTRYAAFIVPTFEIGRLAGRGEEIPAGTSAQNLAFAWTPEQTSPLELPYYYRWEFRTGQRGDFEHLVRLLEPRDLPGVGKRKMDCSAPGYGITGVNADGPELEGALRSVEWTPTAWGHDASSGNPAPTQFDLADLINRPNSALGPVFVLEETSEVYDVDVKASDDFQQILLSWRAENAVASWVEYRINGYWLRLDGEEGDEDHLRYRASIEHADFRFGEAYDFRIFAEKADESVIATEVGNFRLPVARVVPPIYGGRHAARDNLFQSSQSTVDPQEETAWLDVLNLDPRHRAAAGLGAEVVRKQQEALVAAAWDQLGDIDEANFILRRAQLGRESALRVHSRFNEMQDVGDLLQITAPVLRRVPINAPGGNGRKPAHQLLTQESRLPSAVLDGAFRRITRARGPLRRRQRAGRISSVIPRLLSGELRPASPLPKPAGMIRICDVSRNLQASLKPTVTLQVDPVSIQGNDETVTVTWSTQNAGSRVASGAWSGLLPASGQWRVSASDLLREANADGTSGWLSNIPFQLHAFGPGGRAEGYAEVRIRRGSGNEGGSAPGPRPSAEGDRLGSSVEESELEAGLGSGLIDFGPVLTTSPLSRRFNRRWRGPSPGRDPNIPGGVRGAAAPLEPAPLFCDGEFTGKDLDVLEGSPPFVEDIRVVIDEWLERPGKSRPQPPVRGHEFLEGFRASLFDGLNPETNFPARVRRRFKLTPELEEQLAGEARGDPLDDLKSELDFPQPMYESLRDISHELLVPGVESIPQNTIGLLETNRRFIESYMVGLSHSFMDEALFREFPVNPRQTFFRQFWDVSEYVPQPGEEDELWVQWATEVNFQRDDEWPMKRKQKLLRTDLLIVADTLPTALQNNQEDEDNDSSVSPDSRSQLIERLRAGDDSAVNEIPDGGVLDDLVKAVVVRKRLDEKLKDISPLKFWRRSSALGDHPSEAASEGGKSDGESNDMPKESLVLVIRGNLLQRYPNAKIYAIDAVKDPGGQRAPGLQEYLRKKIQDVDNEDSISHIKNALGNPHDNNNSDAIVSFFDSLDDQLNLTNNFQVEEEIEGARWIIRDESNSDPQRYEIHDVGDKLRIFRTVEPAEPVFPIFKATLSPDLTFFGFPFTDDMARSDDDEKLGKYFVIEERIGEPRFGLDSSSSSDEPATWDDLSWKHFTVDGQIIKAGEYVDRADNNPVPSDGGVEFEWTGEGNDVANSAIRGRVTYQRPVRIAVHADEMLPLDQS